MYDFISLSDMTSNDKQQHTYNGKPLTVCITDVSWLHLLTLPSIMLNCISLENKQTYTPCQFQNYLIIWGSFGKKKHPKDENSRLSFIESVNER